MRNRDRKPRLRRDDGIIARARSNRPQNERGQMFHTVLVPSDLTARTTNALDLACRIASADGARVIMLHVIETIDGLSKSEMKPFYNKLERNARAKMTSLARRAPKGVGIGHLITFGKRAEEIVRVADEEKADLLVLPSHRVDPSMPGRDWGTISYKVGILAPCAVMLIK
jgi:nucleotide-binding universal stress UspA family protein